MKYYLLDCGAIQETTDKAYGIVVGSNNLHGKNYKTFIEWIPTSQTIQQNNQIYVTAWLTSKISNQIHFDNYIDIENEQPKIKAPRKSKEQKQLETYNILLNNHFNNEVPSEYIEYYFEGCGDVDNITNARFTTINKLQRIEDNEEIIKIVIVKNGEKEVIRG